MIAAWTSPLRPAPLPNVPLRAIGALAGPSVAYQGEPGAFGDAAVAAHWRGTARAVGAPTFGRAVALLLARRVDAVVLPVWNSSIGPIAGMQALLDEHAARIETIDEVVVPVRHALLALPGASLGTLTAIGSHPAALSQCARFFANHTGVTAHEASDTAGAARQLAGLVDGPARGGSRPWYADVPGASPESLGAIASEAAGARHGLMVLARDVQDQPDNATRFAILRRRRPVGHQADGWLGS